MNVRNQVQKMSLCVMAALFLLCATSVYAEVKIAVIDSGTTDASVESISFSSIPAYKDPASHGTRIARIIQKANPQAEIVMLQVCEAQDGRYKPSSKSVVEAIDWCRENDVDIVNLSLVIEFSREIEEAIQRAYLERGIIFFGAAGNENIFSRFAVNDDGYMYASNKDSGSQFPASHEYVISVGAKDSHGNVTDYSTADVDVFSNGDYAKLQGTSFACARTAGYASKLFNRNMTLEQLKLALLQQK
ncbi:S8 family serine peptidase [Candidatus Omnitrophota bacterium]